MICSFKRITLPAFIGAIITIGGFAPSPAFAQTSGAPPRINSITPSSGPIGAHITVIGSGFDAPELTLKVDDGEVGLPPNQSGNDSITAFNLPMHLTPPMDPHTLDLVRQHRLHVHMKTISLTGGTHQIAIKTAYGTSNAVSFTISAFPGKVTLDQSSLQTTGFPKFSGTAENVDAIGLGLATLDGRPATFRGGFNGYSVPKPIPVRNGRWSVDLHQVAYDAPQLCPLQPGYYRVQLYDAKTHVHFDLPQSRITVLQSK